MEICPVKPLDRYRRWRAIIYYEQEGERRNLNTDLLALGYAQVYTVMPCHVDSAEWIPYVQEAREAERGLWGQDGSVEAGPPQHAWPRPRPQRGLHREQDDAHVPQTDMSEPAHQERAGAGDEP